MPPHFDLSKFKDLSRSKAQYLQQISRLSAEGKEVTCIEAAVNGAIRNLEHTQRTSFVIYGEPQSGKTEMMICLTARLLDEGRSFVLHLLNDSVDLLGQNLGRFQKSGLAPAAKNFTDILDPAVPIKGRQHVIFCKKNARDLEKLWGKIGSVDNIVIIDDEADYASPNSKINQNARTRINELITLLLGATGDYIGVTATPARLDLNNTFDNDSTLWVDFPPHSNYTGQDVFFPLDPAKTPRYRLSLLPPTNDTPLYLRRALFGFFTGVAFLNTRPEAVHSNYSILIHTSGRTADHKVDARIVDEVFEALIDHSSKNFGRYVKEVWDIAAARYGPDSADGITAYVIQNVPRYAVFVLNSDRDFVQNGLSATNPSALFTVIIGGNIVSRGVTFENLLSMFFTRDVKHRLQQDTYIQRARMFGSRGRYLSDFELTIPESLYADWHRCFVFHRLALSAINRNLGSPVWLTDSRISAVASPSIDRSTVDINRGEMGFHLFDSTDEYNHIVAQQLTVAEKMERVSKLLGEAAFPLYLQEYVLAVATDPEKLVAFHPMGSIEGYSDGEPGLDKSRIERRKGLLGTNQLERSKYPNAVHHFKPFENADGKARMYYKFEGSVQFMKNLKS